MSTSRRRRKHTKKVAHVMGLIDQMFRPKDGAPVDPPNVWAMGVKIRQVDTR